MTLGEYLNQPIGPWKNKYNMVFDTLKSQKYGHMVRIQYANPSFYGCPTDDYTNDIEKVTCKLCLKKVNN